MNYCGDKFNKKSLHTCTHETPHDKRSEKLRWRRSILSNKLCIYKWDIIRHSAQGEDNEIDIKQCQAFILAKLVIILHTRTPYFKRRSDFSDHPKEI